MSFKGRPLGISLVLRVARVPAPGNRAGGHGLKRAWTLSWAGFSGDLQWSIFSIRITCGQAEVFPQAHRTLPVGLAMGKWHGGPLFFNVMSPWSEDASLGGSARPMDHWSRASCHVRGWGAERRVWRPTSRGRDDTPTRRKDRRERHESAVARGARGRGPPRVPPRAPR